MFEYLTTHARVEGQLLQGYVDAAGTTSSKAFAYVVNLLAEDERRHHRLFAELAESLRVDAELSRDEPIIPRLDFHHADHRAIQEMTKALIANEESDAAELKRLRKKLRDLEHTTLWTLLVETMQRDTDKHLAMLRFIASHA